MQGATLVFDLDGTLIDTAPDLIRAGNHVMSLEGLAPVEAALLRPAISHGARVIITTALAHHGRTLADPAIDDLLAAFLAFYADNIAVESRPFPAMTERLAHYAGRGARLAVCTNKREGLSRKLLDELGLTDQFQAICGRDTFPVCKPHPDHLTGAIAMAGGDVARAVMVGDSNTDVLTAKAAGIPVIGVTFGYTDVPVTELGCDAVIEHYDELDAALARLGFA